MQKRIFDSFKYTYKYITIVILFALLHVAVAEASPRPAENIVCTVYPVYAIAAALASGTELKLSLLLPASLGCPHDYSLTPSDISKLENASLILANGLGFEPFLSRLSEVGLGGKIRETAPASAAIPAPYGNALNPHIFTTPRGLAVMTNAVAKALTEVLSSDSAALVERRAEALCVVLDEVAADWRRAKEKLSGVPVIVAHDSLDYIASELGLEIVGRLESGEGLRLSVAEMLMLENAIKTRHPSAVLTEASPSQEISAFAAEHSLKLIDVPILNAGPYECSIEDIERTLKALVAALETLASNKIK